MNACLRAFISPWSSALLYQWIGRGWDQLTWGCCMTARFTHIHTHLHARAQHTHTHTRACAWWTWMQRLRWVSQVSQICNVLPQIIARRRNVSPWDYTVKHTWNLGSSFSWTFSHRLFPFPDFDQYSFIIVMPDYKDNFSKFSVSFQWIITHQAGLETPDPKALREELKSTDQQPALTSTHPNENIWGPWALVELLNVCSCMNKPRKANRRIPRQSVKLWVYYILPFFKKKNWDQFLLYRPHWPKSSDPLASVSPLLRV